MSRWRGEAIERLPELRKAITSADSVMALWIDLWSAFEAAYRVDPPDKLLIARIYSYADWCVQAPRGSDAGHDPLSAVTTGFYEKIPVFRPARDDMPRWFRHAEVAQHKVVFGYLITGVEFEELLRYMDKNRGRYKPRDRDRIGGGGPARSRRT